MERGLLNDSENARAEAFKNKHYKKHKKTASVILITTATGIADHVTIECPYCRKKEDISDYDSW